MKRLELVRKGEEPAARNLRLVPPPKPRRRPRRRWKTGRIRKPEYQAVPELLRYEEQIVLKVFRETEERVGRALSTKGLMNLHPGRFERRYLYLTLMRLAAQGFLITHGHGWLRWSEYQPTWVGRPWWKQRVNPYRLFSTVGGKGHGKL